MSWNSSKNDSNTTTYGTDESYFAAYFKFPTARLSDEEIQYYASMTPSDRIEWLLMMQEMLWNQVQAQEKQQKS